MKKICFVMPYHILENRGGGAEVQAWLMAKELARRGFDVVYIAQSVKGKAGRLETIDNVKVRWVKYAHYFRWANGWSYYRALKEENPDIIVQRMASFVTGIIGFYAKKFKKKFVWICTDNESPRKWLFLNEQKKITRENKVNLLKAIVFLFNAIIYDFSRQWGMKRISFAFTQNEIQKKLLKEEFGLESFRMISGHDVPTNKRPIEERLTNKIVLWVASFGQKKRPEKFIELARIARNTDFRFIMIGSKDDKAYVRNLFEDKPDNLEWLGRLPFEETILWFDQAAFFINTSSNRGEGFPNTFIQAWLRGVPVVTLEVDPDGIIEKHKLGKVSRDVRGMLDSLIELSKDNAAYKQISEEAIHYAKEKHSISAMVENFLNILGP